MVVIGRYRIERTGLLKERQRDRDGSHSAMSFQEDEVSQSDGKFPPHDWPRILTWISRGRPNRIRAALPDRAFRHTRASLERHCCQAEAGHGPVAPNLNPILLDDGSPEVRGLSAAGRQDRVGQCVRAIVGHHISSKVHPWTEGLALPGRFLEAGWAPRRPPALPCPGWE